MKWFGHFARWVMSRGLLGGMKVVQLMTLKRLKNQNLGLWPMLILVL